MNGPHMSFFGNLVDDPQERYSANNGIPFTTMRVATNTYRGAEETQDTHYFQVTLWRHHAQNAIRNCQKGQMVYVQGQYSYREYIRPDGQPGYTHHVTAKEFRQFARIPPREQDPSPLQEPPQEPTDPPADTGENPVSEENPSDAAY